MSQQMQYATRTNLNAVDQCTIYFIRCLRHTKCDLFEAGEPQKSGWTASGPCEIEPPLVVKCIACHPVNQSMLKNEEICTAKQELYAGTSLVLPERKA